MTLIDLQKIVNDLVKDFGKTNAKDIWIVVESEEGSDWKPVLQCRTGYLKLILCTWQTPGVTATFGEQK